MNQPLDTALVHQSVPDHGQWQAHLTLGFANRPRGVRLVKSEHRGPLYVQKAFYPEGPDCAHAYLLHPPGGLVTGDTLSIAIEASAETHVLITTPGAGRVYKARDNGGVQTQNLQLSVGENATLEWLPLETILFPNAHARMRSRVDLAPGAHFMGWEVTCFGLPANQVAFETGSVNQQFQIWRDERLVFNESLVIEAENARYLSGNAALRNCPVHGFIIAGPFDMPQQECIEALRAISLESEPDALLATTHVGAFISVRYLGHCSERARKRLTEAWAILRPALIGKEAVEPRIWRT